MTDKNRPPAATDTDMVERVVQQLDQQAGEIDGATLSRLNRGRQAALDSYGKRPLWRLLTVSPATAGLGLAAMVTLAMALNWFTASGDYLPPEKGAEFASIDAMTDIELLAADAAPELLADLEFFYWLDQELAGEPLDPQTLPAESSRAAVNTG